MHGVLDTSLGWVSNGSTGSQAFAASELGFDVWLGNSRANPPRAHRRELHTVPACVSTANCTCAAKASPEGVMPAVRSCPDE